MAAILSRGGGGVGGGWGGGDVGGGGGVCVCVCVGGGGGGGVKAWTKMCHCWFNQWIGTLQATGHYYLN